MLLWRWCICRIVRSLFSIHLAAVRRGLRHCYWTRWIWSNIWSCLIVAWWQICLGLNYLHNRCLNFSIDGALVTTAIPRAATAAETGYTTHYQSNYYSCDDYHGNDDAESGFHRKLLGVATIGPFIGYIVAAIRLVGRI